MRIICIELIPDGAARHTVEKCRITVRYSHGDEVLHTIAGGPGEEKLAEWLNAGESPTVSKCYGPGLGPGMVVSFSHSNGEVLHRVTFRPSP